MRTISHPRERDRHQVNLPWRLGSLGDQRTARKEIRDGPHGLTERPARPFSFADARVVGVDDAPLSAQKKTYTGLRAECCIVAAGEPDRWLALRLAGGRNQKSRPATTRPGEIA